MFNSKDQLINESRLIVQDAIDLYQPSKILVSYSGGHDSATLLHLMTKLDIPFDVFTIDTGIGSKDHLSNIVDLVCNQLNLKLWIYSGNGREWYLDNVKQEGFAYTPIYHIVYYRNLKERAIELALKDFKTHRLDHIMFLTGVRRLESSKRAKSPTHHKKGSRITCNPIVKYSDKDKEIIMQDNHWYKGRLTNDCFCNWHCKYTLDDIDHQSTLYQDIKTLNDEMQSLGLWEYGQKPSSDLIQYEQDEQDEMPEDSLCINCYSKSLL